MLQTYKFNIRCFERYWQLFSLQQPINDGIYKFEFLKPKWSIVSKICIPKLLKPHGKQNCVISLFVRFQAICNLPISWQFFKTYGICSNALVAIIHLFTICLDFVILLNLIVSGNDADEISLFIIIFDQLCLIFFLFVLIGSF